MGKMINTRKQATVQIVELLDEKLSGLSDLDSLISELTEYIEDQQPDKLLVTFATVKFVTSDGIEVILRIRQAVDAYGGSLKLCGMTEVVRTSFKLLNLDGTVFEIYDNEDDAIAAF